MSSRVRLAAVVVPIAVALVFVAGACGGGKPKPGTLPSPSPSVSATVAPPTAKATPTATATNPTTTAPTRTTAPAAGVSRVAYQWNWPNDTGSAEVAHTYNVPPLPTLIGISSAGHRDLGKPPFDRVSFTFTTTFPSYEFAWVSKPEFTGDGSGQVVPIAGDDVLKITFRQARAHNDAGQSTAPRSGTVRGLGGIIAYANAGDFEGVATYGLGAHRWVFESNPQTAVRVYEVVRIVNGQRTYIVAFDVDASH